MSRSDAAPPVPDAESARDAAEQGRDADEAARDADEPGQDAGSRDALAMMLDAEAMLDAAMGFDAGLFAPDASAACVYPAGAVEPMARDQVITPYAWPSGIDAANVSFPLDLAQAACNTDPNRDWAPYDAILFVSFPSW